jgi:hypothetical protein
MSRRRDRFEGQIMSNLTIMGVDYAKTSKDYDALKAKGIKFAMRYISHDPGKDLTLAEKKELHKRDIKIGVVFETKAQRAIDGHAAGAADGAFADERVKKLGLAGIPIYFAVDWDVADAQKTKVATYLKGVESVIGKTRTGVYGGYGIVKYVVEHDVCSWFWQTYAWSGGHIHPSVHIHQYHNDATIGTMSVDLNHGSTTGFGARGPVTSAADQTPPAGEHAALEQV